MALPGKGFGTSPLERRLMTLLDLLANWILNMQGTLMLANIKSRNFSRDLWYLWRCLHNHGERPCCKKLLWPVHSKAAPVWSPAHLSCIPFVVSTVNKCNLFQRWHLVLSEHVTCAALYCELNIQIVFIGYDCSYLQPSHLNLWVAY